MEVDRREEVVQGVESQPSTQIPANDSSKEETTSAPVEEKEERKVEDSVENTLKRRLSSAGSEQGENTAEQDATESKNTSKVEDPPEVKRPRLVEDKEVKRRGQRMFGMLLGTLNKIKDQSQHKSEAEIKREKLEQKLQEKLKKEKEELAEKVKTEQESRKEKILAQRKIDERKRKSELRESLKSHKIKLAGFLMTKTKPALYYLPAKPSGRHLDTIAEQKKAVEEEFKKLEQHDMEEERMEQENLPHSEDHTMEDAAGPEVATINKKADSNDNELDTTAPANSAEQKSSNEDEQPSELEQAATSMDIEPTQKE